MILAWLLLLTGLTISAVAIYYSVVGLAAIFSAAVIPIIIMGSALEVGKLVCASWLKANWERAPRFMKYYMITAVMVLMLITSMGIFGFLSKAHNDQNLVSGDVQSKIAIYDEKIKTARENIEANRKQLKQMDEAVDQVMARSDSERGAERSNAIRKSQQRDRVALARDIEANQKLIATLNDESAPIRAEVRKVEAEVGPIKYIAKFIYGDKGADENMLEKAVTWVIILIVVVFDPLAVIMLLAAQMTFGWLREQKQLEENTPDPYVADVGDKPTPEEKDDFLPTYEEITPERNFDYPPSSDLWPFPKAEPRALDDLPDLHKIVKEGLEDGSLTIQGQTEEPVDQYAYLKQDKSFWDKPEGWESVGPLVGKPEDETSETPASDEDVKKIEKKLDIIHKLHTSAEESQESLTVDTTEVKVDEPTYKILPELEEESKKKDLHDQGERGTDSQEQVSYVQNAEQDESTIWQRIKSRDQLAPADRLYSEYGVDEFQNLDISQEEDQEFINFVNRIKERGPKFSIYSQDQLEKFAQRINELRKN